MVKDYIPRGSRRPAPLIAAAVLLLLMSGSVWSSQAGPASKPVEHGMFEGLAVPDGPLYLAPDGVDDATLGEFFPVQEYDHDRLIVIQRPESLPAAVRDRLTPVEDRLTLTYRGWKGRLPGLSLSQLATMPDGYYLIALVGPEDESWRKHFADFGVEVVDRAWPNGLVVHADGTQLLGAASSVATTYGYSVVQGIAPVPVDTRLSGELLRVAKGEITLAAIPGLRRDAEGRAVVRLFFFNDPAGDKKPLDLRAQKLVEVRKYARIPGSDLAYGYDDAVLIGGPEDIQKILAGLPSVAYMEAIHESQTDDHAQVYYPIAMAVAPPLYTVKPIVPAQAAQPSVMPEEEIPDWVNGKHEPGPETNVLPGEAVVQNWVGKQSMPSPIANFEGLGTGLSGFSMTGAPPDTEGDVGPNHYVQWVNSMFAIFNKSTGAVLYGPANGKTLFTSLGGRCASDNDGDPLVMYDKIADRWFMSQFAVSGTPYTQCIAVSQTNNPVTTGWNLYAYSYGSNFNDYGKSGVWPDGYYIMYHMFANGTSWAGTEVCAFDRVKMLAGQTATQQCFGPNSSYGGLLPSHFQGSTLPPAGSPNYFVAYGTNRLLFWPFHVDWTNSNYSTFPFNSPTNITVASFSEPCGGTGGTCVPQKGTTNQLDTLGDRLMWRMNYRNFGTYESLVLNHSITGGAGTGIRWYEIRNPSTTPTIYQQGTFAPSDTTWRWMGSVNMDKNGDIAAGYSASSSSMNPSLWYSGRLVTDALNTFGQGEGTLFSGTGSQLAGSNPSRPLTRWGDYSTMSVDPSDDCTFWFTSEYLSSDGTFNWRTRICSFKFPSCTTCTPPGAPAITDIADESGCAQSGIRVTYTAGSGATSHNLLKDDAVAVTGYSSGALYNPGDTASHAYKVQAVDGTCTTNSAAQNFTDANGSPAAPAAPSVIDLNACSQTGVQVTWHDVTGATAYDVRVDGTTILSGVTSPYTYNPGNTASHTYEARGRNASCTGEWSSPTAFADSNGVLSTPGAPTFSGVGCAGVTVNWSGVTGATDYDVYRASGSTCTGAVKITATPVSGTSYADGALSPGSPYSYFVVANGPCGSSANGACASVTTTVCTPNVVYSANGSWAQVASMGNDDAVMDPGESWSVSVTLTNSGTAQATSVVAALAGTGLTSCSGLVDYGTLAPGANAVRTHTFTVDSGFSCQTNASFNVVGKASTEKTYPDETAVFTKMVGSAGGGTTKNYPQTSGLPLAIPDNSATGVTSTLTIADTGTITDINVNVGATHTYVGDLIFTLTHVETGTTVTLIDRPGVPASSYGCSGDNIAATLDDAAATPVEGVCAGSTPTINGTFSPNQALSAFNNQSLTGTWQLKVSDNASQDTGSLTSWSLDITTAAPLCNVWSGANCLPAAPGEVSPGTSLAQALQWSGDKASLEWQTPTGAVTGYRLYRGALADLPNLLGANQDSCTRYQGAQMSADVSADAPDLVAGGFYWYLVAAYNGSGEGSAGDATDGARVVNTQGTCP